MSAVKSLRCAKGIVCVLAAMAAGMAVATDWGAINKAAREQAAKPVRLGEPGKAPFWNAYAFEFIHPPAFDAKETPGAAAYLMTLTDEATGKALSFKADKPWRPLTPIWDAAPVGYQRLTVTLVDAAGKKLPDSFSRRFYRAAVFKGPYPPAKRGYREAANACFEGACRLPQVRKFLTDKEPTPKYDLFCYPSKILASCIEVCVLHAAAAPEAEKKDLMTMARNMADWLIDHSQPEGTPLECLPPTYWGKARREAVYNAGRNMMLYPPLVADAYFALADATGDAKYGDAALRIAKTMRRLQLPNGTWWLLIEERSGKPVGKNLVFPFLQLVNMFERAAKITGDSSWLDVANRAWGHVETTRFKNWDWEGQFEDQRPTSAYKNLAKGAAVDFARWLISQGRVKEALEVIDWCEDQFVVWSQPLKHTGSDGWKTPTALEQYQYYTPIDASMGDMIYAFSAAYRATKGPLYLAKARALADNVTRNQREDGTIPTYFDCSRHNSDWINCMVYTAKALMEMPDEEPL